MAAAIAATELTFSAVGTPASGGRIDLKYVEAAASEIGVALRGIRRTTTPKSTVIPGILGPGIWIGHESRFSPGDAVADFSSFSKLAGELRIKQCWGKGVAIQAGCIPTPFPANLSLHRRAKSSTDPASGENIPTWHGVGRLPRRCRLRQGRDCELARLPCNRRGRATDARDQSKRLGGGADGYGRHASRDRPRMPAAAKFRDPVRWRLFARADTKGRGRGVFARSGSHGPD